MTLRLRMTLVVVAIVAVGLLAADVITYTTLHSYLTGQVDNELADAVHPIGQALVRQVDGSAGLFQPEYDDPIVPPGTFAELRDQNGTPLAVGGIAYGTGPTLPSALPGSGLAATGPLFFTTSGQSTAGVRTTYRVEAEAVAVDGQLFGTVVVAIPLTATEQTIGRLLLIEGLVTVVLLIGLAVLSWWIVRRELRPLDDMATTAGEIAAGDLSQRVAPEDNATEVGRLGHALNTMLGEIEEAFDARRASEERLRRFLADASHELRTPLTSIRGYAEIFDRGAKDRPGDLETSMHHIRSEAGRMSELVDDLLLLARMDQERPIEHELVDLREVAEQAVDAMRVAAPESNLTLVAPTPVTVLGDASRLRQVVDNLLTNAVRHAPATSPVQVRTWSTGAAAILDVIDHGPGIPHEDREKIFEPFHRADPSRARATGGVGLGLAIVSAIAQAHNGEVGVVDTEGGGATFWVRLPLAVTTDDAASVSSGAEP
ncbi:MAG TPA: HAMP domain-containing sensor histidine kinase [Acidimicrobiales bacterium]|nr:HAMP domain-containing sensor histidine kinase [Acidimicrobiales bacterium]